MKRLFIYFIVILLTISCASQQQLADYGLPRSSAFNFIIISDYGRNGFAHQKEVAEIMGNIAEKVNARFIVTGGDNFQISGVESVSDPLWYSCFENVYTHPSLHVEWYPAFGNHDHLGSLQAQIDYSKISRRWKMPAPYYTLVKTRDSVSLRLIILDTQSLVNGLGNPSKRYTTEDAMKQIHWADSVLASEKEDWVIVVGHHPVYSAHPTRGNTEELVEYLRPVLNKYNVDFYIGSHDHIFQHLKDSTSIIDYFVNTAGSSVRDVASNNMTVFAASSPGFSIISATKKDLSIYFIGIEGKALYKYIREKK
ncbi:MAG TPA: metallophosphoesterase [Bacteroidales bacterium]|nr:metallophosphoesterase [Bacteroidales bacterium]